MVTYETTTREDAGDPFRDPSTMPPQQPPVSPMMPSPHSPNPHPHQQQGHPAGPYNMQGMQDALPDNNPYRQIQKQRTGNSEGSYPGPQSYLSAGPAHHRTGSQEHQLPDNYLPIQQPQSPHPPSSYHSTPPTSYNPRNPSVSSIGSSAYSGQPMQTAQGSMFQMESDKHTQSGPFVGGTAPTEQNKGGDWWDSPLSSRGASPTEDKKQLSLEEQLENEFHRGKGVIAPAAPQLMQQPQQQMFQPPQNLYSEVSQPSSQQNQQNAPGFFSLPQPPTAPGQQQHVPPQNQQNADDVFGPSPVSSTPAIPARPPAIQQPSLLDMDEIQSGAQKEVDKTSEAPVPVPTGSTTQPSVPAASVPPSIPLETYQIKHIRFLNPETNKLAQSSMLIQNENGPCPLIALVNVLSLSRETLVLGEGLRIRETLSLELLLNVVCEELVLTGSWAGDLSELFNFLMGLRTGMNVNPKFISDDIKADDFLGNANVRENRALPQPQPGDFEKTRELDLYSAFGIPLVHGWIPAPTSPMFPVLVQHARDFEKAQDIIIQQQFILEKSSRGETITPEDSEIAAKGHEIQEFLESQGTQLTSYGLNVLQRKLQPGSWSIFFRNSHFSTLYKHARTGELYTLVSDSGYASYEEIVWESLVDSTGRGGSYFSGDFRPVGNDNSVSQRQSDNILDPNRGEGWQQVQTRRSSRGQTNVDGVTGQRRQVQSLIPPETAPQAPIVPPDTTGDTTDYDLALAIHLQQEEEERANRIAHNRAGVHPSRVTNLTSANQPPVRSLIPADTPTQPPTMGIRPRPQSTSNFRPPQPPRPSGRQAEELRASANNNSNNQEEIPPPYAAADPNPTAYLPPIDPPGPGNMSRHSSFPVHGSPTHGRGTFSRTDTGSAYSQMSSVYGTAGPQASNSSHFPGSGAARGRRASHMGAHPMAAQQEGEDKKNCSIM